MGAGCASRGAREPIGVREGDRGGPAPGTHSPASRRCFGELGTPPGTQPGRWACCPPVWNCARRLEGGTNKGCVRSAPRARLPRGGLVGAEPADGGASTVARLPHRPPHPRPTLAPSSRGPPGRHGQHGRGWELLEQPSTCGTMERDDAASPPALQTGDRGPGSGKWVTLNHSEQLPGSAAEPVLGAPTPIPPESPLSLDF